MSLSDGLCGRSILSVTKYNNRASRKGFDYGANKVGIKRDELRSPRITKESLCDRARICWFHFEAHPRLTYKKFDRVLRMMLTLYPR